MLLQLQVNNSTSFLQSGIPTEKVNLEQQCRIVQIYMMRENLTPLTSPLWDRVNAVLTLDLQIRVKPSNVCSPRQGAAIGQGAGIRWNILLLFAGSLPASV